MKTLPYILYYVSTMFSLIGHVKGLPADYCVPPPNLDDCKGEPQQVFSYYKSGSRCEIETWRGCPSMNIFENEYECSHNCIGRLWGNLWDTSDNDIPENQRNDTPENQRNDIPENQPDSEQPNECEEIMNTEDCQEGPFKVYTYNSNTKTCIIAEWKGCETKNKFNDEESCKNKCGGLNWDEKIVNLSEKDAKEIDKILDSILETNDTEVNNHDDSKIAIKLKKTIEKKPIVDTTEVEVVTEETESIESTTDATTSTEEHTEEYYVGQADEILTT